MRKPGKRLIPANNLQFYLNFLNNTPQLSPKEEYALLKKMQTIKAKLFTKCYPFLLFRKEVVDLLRRKIRVDKTLKPYPTGLKNRHSTVVEQALAISQICDGILTQDDWEPQAKLISITGNFATALLEVIESKYIFMQRKARLNEQVEFFKVSSFDKLIALSNLCSKNPQLRTTISDRLQKTPAQVYRNLQKVLTYIEDSTKLKHLDVDSEYMLSLSIIHTYVGDMEKELEPVRRELVNRNLRLVVARAKYFIGRGFDFESIVQEGNLGLLKALDKYSLEHKVRLSTYSTWWIDQTIQRAIANKSKVVRIPTHIQTLHVLMKSAITDLTDTLGREPSEKELACKMDENIGTIRMLKNVAQHNTALEQEMDDGTVISVNTSKEDATLNPFHTASRNLLKEKVHEVLANLPPLFQKIIRLKYGIGEEAQTVRPDKVLAEDLSLDVLIVRSCVRRTLKKLKNNKNLQEEELK